MQFEAYDNDVENAVENDYVISEVNAPTKVSTDYLKDYLYCFQYATYNLYFSKWQWKQFIL